MIIFFIYLITIQYFYRVSQLDIILLYVTGNTNVKVGDTVEVLYRDQMGEENDHTIREATSASKVTIIDGQALIFE